MEPLIISQILLIDGFCPLDVVGPFDVLSAGRATQGCNLEVRLVATDLRPFTAGSDAFSLTPTHRLDPSLPGHVVVPGVSGPLNGPGSIPELLGRFAQSPAVATLREALDNPSITVATVCAGSLGMAMAGLLAGRNVTTNLAVTSELSQSGVTVRPGRIVDDGDLISARGVTSGVDLGLYLLERDFGPQAALGVEAMFEHERRGTVWTRQLGGNPAGH